MGSLVLLEYEGANKGFDKNLSFPHTKYTQLVFAATVPFSTLDIHARTLLFSNAFSLLYVPPIHVTPVGTTHKVLTELSGLCRHSDLSG